MAPTHTCFDDVLEYLEELALRGVPPREIARYVIVHAICVAPDGVLFAHGWLECNGQVIQGGILDGQRVFYAIPLADFRSLFQVAEQTRYTAMQAIAENMRTGHFGPWVEQYRELSVADPDAEKQVWDPQRPPLMAVVERGRK